jgi:hypothetical protein
LFELEYAGQEERMENTAENCADCEKMRADPSAKAQKKSHGLIPHPKVTSGRGIVMC